MSSSQQEQAALLVETFEMLGDWEEKYRFIIDLGRQMPAMPDAQKTEENKVRGCLSSVWVVAESREEASEQVIEFVADSDSAIVRGLVAMLRTLYSGQTPRDILSFDIDALFERLDLGQHLSMGRRNGLSEMVRRIKVLATEHASN
jgi:cysteine desulfuration protein SufE